MHYGHARLESWELISILIWSGIQGSSVFKISKKISRLLEEKKGNIQIQDIQNISWIWPVKAMQIMSAFELARRYFSEDVIYITSVQDIVQEVKEYRNRKQEYLICLTLDGANRLIQKHVITIGILNQSLVHPREVFAPAIEDRANSIVLVHNHPSGTPYPSKEDNQITMRLQEASKIIGIHLLDHVIITQHEHYSYCHEQKL